MSTDIIEGMFPLLDDGVFDLEGTPTKKQILNRFAKIQHFCNKEMFYSHFFHRLVEKKEGLIKSVIRLWVDCPLMSCSMLLA